LTFIKRFKVFLVPENKVSITVTYKPQLWWCHEAIARNDRWFAYLLKAVQDAFFHFFSMPLNGAYASKFETGWEPWVFMVQL
jgi:hypothetical protein